MQTQEQSGSWGQGEANAKGFFFPTKAEKVLGFVL